MPAGSSEQRWAPSSLATSWPWIVAASLIAAAAMAAAMNVHYDATFQWQAQQLGPLDQALLFWVIASACAWALAPGLAIAAGLLLAGRSQLAWIVAGASTAAALFWLAVDLRVDVVTGKHALDYLRFLSGEEPWQWAGGLGDVFWPMAALGGTVAACTLAGIGSAYWVSRRMPASGYGTAAAATAVYGLALFGPALGVGSFEHPLVLMRLAEALPLEPPFFESERAWQGGRAALVGELNQNLASVYERHAPGLARSHPVENVLVQPREGAPPNIVVIVIESLRHDATSARWMPRVHAFANEHALRSTRHYSSSHASHLGLFSLLFGQSPLVYERTLEARIAAQLPHSLRRSGYHASLLSSSALDWQRMDEFLSPRNFDEIVIEDKGRWPRRDARTLRHLRRRLATTAEPQFAFVFLMSTHYNYQYPPAYAKHQPVVEKGVLNWDRLLEGEDVGPRYREGLLNRYRNSLAYLDDQIGDLLESLDLERNIVVLTGDHGESFYDDGRFLHGSRLSDAQLQVPWWIAGPGIAPGELSGPTSHLDLLPTLLHAAAGRPVELPRAQGRDLLAGNDAGTERELLLVGMGAQYQHLLLLRGADRMHLRLDYTGQALQTLGFLDEKGGYLPDDGAGETDPLLWLDAVDRQLGTVAQ